MKKKLGSPAILFKRGVVQFPSLGKGLFIRKGALNSKQMLYSVGVETFMYLLLD